jgi:hypothetical protein
MPSSFLSRNGKGLLLGSGAAVLVGGFLLFLFGGGWYLVLLLFMGLSTHDNDAPAGQLTVAQGTVLNAETRQPIPGMLLSVRSYSGYNPSNAARATDSGRTDAQGRYRLRFRNQPGRYYQVVVDYPPGDFPAPPTRYWFANPDDTASARDLTLGRANTVNFYPGERHTLAVRLHNRRTGYRFLQMPDGYELPLSDRDTTIHLTYYELPATGLKLHYLKRSGEEGEVDDTAVALVLKNPAARFPDTIQATLTLVR